MNYRRQGKVQEKSNLAELSPLQKWILLHEGLSNWRDFGTVLNLCKPYKSASGRMILGTNLQVSRALKGLVTRGLLEVRR